MNYRAIATVCLISAGAWAQEPPVKPQTNMPRPPADLTITEVLWKVPKGLDGDAGGDGVRQANGDEFVELVNTGKKPFQLKGWILIDSGAYSKLTSKGTQELDPKALKPDGSEIVFVFPELEIKPGEVVVVFNGFQQKFAGPVGDTARTPEPNPGFSGAFVFSMNINNKFAGFGDKGDWVMLADPAGKPMEVVSWGKPDVAPPASAATHSTLPEECKGSASRTSRGGQFVDTASLGGPLFTPGVFSPAGNRNATTDKAHHNGPSNKGPDGPIMPGNPNTPKEPE